MMQLQIERRVGHHYQMDKAGIDEYLNIYCNKETISCGSNRHRHLFTIYKNGQFLMDICFCGKRWHDQDILED